MSSLKEQIGSLSNFVEILKMECTKAYRSKVSFMISSLKTHAEKLDMIVPYYTLMQAFQSSKHKTPPTNTLIPSPHSKEIT